jgi:hypothetical protein
MSAFSLPDILAILSDNTYARHNQHGDNFELRFGSNPDSLQGAVCFESGGLNQLDYLSTQNLFHCYDVPGFNIWHPFVYCKLLPKITGCP